MIASLLIILFLSYFAGQKKISENNKKQNVQEPVKNHTNEDDPLQ